MKVTLGKEGLAKSWQDGFPETTECVYCQSNSRIGFVAHEGLDDDDKAIWPRDYVQFVNDLHRNEYREGGYWLHDCCAVAVYFCWNCLKPTALYNQG